LPAPSVTPQSSIGLGGIIAAIYVLIADLFSVLKRHWAIRAAAQGYFIEP
jgi:hypothetical protein